MRSMSASSTRPSPRLNVTDQSYTSIQVPSPENIVRSRAGAAAARRGGSVVVVGGNVVVVGGGRVVVVVGATVVVVLVIITGPATTGESPWSRRQARPPRARTSARRPPSAGRTVRRVPTALSRLGSPPGLLLAGA